MIQEEKLITSDQSIEFFNKIKELNKDKFTNLKIITENLNSVIKKQVTFLFPNLNFEDTELLVDLSYFLIGIISEKFYFKNSIEYKKHWIQNNFRNIKCIIIKILPFIDDKNNFLLYKKVKDLNHILFYSDLKKIPKKELDVLTQKESIEKYFPICNFSLGLLNNDNEEILELYNEKGVKLIYDIIHHNFIALLESIKISCNKMYVNWINVIPIHFETLEKSDVYKNTIDERRGYKNISNINDPDTYLSFENEYNGLYIGDFFNVYRRGYFENIKSIKWLIFNKIPKDKKQIKDLPEGEYFIQTLEKNLDISNYLYCDKYDDLPEDLKYKFDYKLKAFVKNSDSRFEILEVIKSILMFLINNYTYTFIIKKEIVSKYSLKQLQKYSTEIKDDDYNKNLINKIKKMKTSEIINDFNSIGTKHIYNFIIESISKFRQTIYSTFLFTDDNKIKTDYFYIKLEKFNSKKKEEITTDLNLKNLYNISKTLSFFSDNNDTWESLRESFSSLALGEKTNFFQKFTDESLSWLDIRKNLQNQLQENNFNQSILFQRIIESWNKHKVDFIFYYFIRNGLLTKFEPNLSLTDDLLLPTNNKTKMKKITEGIKRMVKEQNLGESYYYLTNEKYKNMEKYYEKDKETLQYKNFIDKIMKDYVWITFYAMDWITQINFFHSYINHQILFVTGSTGTGKSTQVPKLLLYSLKAIDFKDNGKISCTQPRIPPTVGNAERISYELGVPIKSLDVDSDLNLPTSNYFVEYKTSEQSHVSINKGLQLKITTDGTLFEEIVQNPVMKKKLFDKKEENYIFSLENIYDIIIVDEAHEHGKNMDLILTLGRNSCYYNNSLKFVIISATMDDDEPTYRTYFKSINDNFQFPIKFPLVKHPFLNIRNFLPQTIFMERRFHISKPGETTQFKITEEDRSFNISNIDKPWIEIQNHSYAIVKEILERHQNGNILLFLTGEKEIKMAVQELNRIIPKDSVALPYFSKMNEKYKEIISKIDVNLPKIKNQKNKIYQEWGDIFFEGNSSNYFTRAVIIATNVAEASITIPNLKFVVDNGYSKQSSFNYIRQESILEEKMISNTSRDQRKGRVGRISDGTVYYLYDKSKPNNIKTRYNISYEDFTNEFIKLFDNVESTEKKNYYNEYFFHRAIDNNFSKFINTDPRIKNNIVSASVNNNEFSIINEFENSIQRIIFYQFYTVCLK